MNAANIGANMAYFLTHPVATPYYIMPIAMLSVWTVLFGYVLHTRESDSAKLIPA
jgi:hypothetical protein